MPAWLHSLKTIFAHPLARYLLLTLYYLAIALALVVMYGRGNVPTVKFVYQGF